MSWTVAGSASSTYADAFGDESGSAVYAEGGYVIGNYVRVGWNDSAEADDVWVDV
jgi:hypothetical protein